MTRIIVFMDFTQGVCHIEAGSIPGSIYEEVAMGAELGKMLSDEVAKLSQKYGLTELKTEMVETDIPKERFPRANP